MTSEILALTDALGDLVRFRPMPGQRHDSVEVPSLIEGIAFAGLVADKALDNNALVAELDDRGVRIVHLPAPGRAQRLKIDAAIYAWSSSTRTASASSSSSNASPCATVRPTAVSKR